MAAIATDIVSRIAELSDSAFNAFCEDIGGMFGVEMRCDRKGAEVSTVPKLRDQFKKLTAVHLTKADGALNGTFQLVFDQGGLFILSGVVVMLPESRILDEAKRGSIEDATNMQDAAREVGNLLVGSWDRVFRENCPGHEHFVKTSTVLGKPWEKPEQIGLQADMEVLVVAYEMSVEPYPSFKCAAVVPCTVMDGFGEAKTAGTDPEPAGTSPRPAESSPEPAQGSAPVRKPSEPAASEKPVPEPAKGTTSTEQDKSRDSGPAAHDASPESRTPAVVSGAAVKTSEDRSSPVLPAPGQGNGFIPPGRRSPMVDANMLPSELASTQPGGAASRGAGFTFLDAAYIQAQPQAGLGEFLSIKAAEIMDKEVVWAGPEDTVQDVIAKMQQHNVGYVLVGTNQVLEGLISGSNILGAVSLYLRPMFAKWRRPQDDATLGVKVKWIMSRPVRTVRPDATLASMIETMRRCGGRCLPVVDAKGAVQGMVTVFDILLRVLESDKSISWKGKPPQAPPLLI
jgi:CBS domain-containing protein